MSILEEEGPESFLSFEERTQLRRYLKDASEFPTEFGSWVDERVSTNAVLQKSQVQGLPLLNSQVQQALQDIEDQQIRVYTDTEAAQVAFNTQTPTVSTGPTLTELPSGIYLCLYSATMHSDHPDSDCYFGVTAEGVGSAPVLTTTTDANLSHYTIFALTSQTSTINAYHWTEWATGRWSNRNITALRIAPST